MMTTQMVCSCSKLMLSACFSWEIEGVKYIMTNQHGGSNGEDL